MLRFAKVVPHARPPEKLNVSDPGLTIFSAEDFKVEWGEVHAYRTGIVLEIPEGDIVLLRENNNMGVKGVVVAGSLLTANNIGEVRVNLTNQHREAFEVKAGDPLCFAILLQACGDGEAEEYDLEGLTNEMQTAATEAKAESDKLKFRKKADEAAAAVPK